MANGFDWKKDFAMPTETATPELQFNPDRHEYRLGDKLLVPVSSIIEWAGIKGFMAGGGGGGGPNLAALVGTATHAAIKLDVEGRLDESTVDRRAMGYLAGFRAFKNDLNILPLNWELMVWNEAAGVAGTLDMVCTLQGIKGWWLLDYKTGAKCDWHAIQTAAYAWLKGDRTLNRACLYLREDGSYKLDEHKSPLDFDAWLGCIALANWRKARGLVA